MKQSIELHVAGMTCGSCVSTVTKAIRQVSGVSDVQVDLRSGTVRITGEEVSRQVPAMQAALASAGYSATTTPSPVTSSTPLSSPRAGGGCCCH